MLLGAHRNVCILNEKPTLHLSLNQDICKIRMLLCFMGKRPAEARVPLSVDMLLWGGRCPAPRPRAGRKREEGAHRLQAPRRGGSLVPAWRGHEAQPRALGSRRGAVAHRRVSVGPQPAQPAGFWSSDAPAWAAWGAGWGFLFGARELI